MACRPLNLLCESALNLVAKNSSQLNYQSVRHKNWANKRPIMGWPRPHLYNKFKKYPEAHTYNWLPYLPEDGSYTIKPLPIYKMAGRDMTTGRVVVRTLGGGNPKKFRWVDPIKKANDDGSVKEERVLQIKYDPLHTPKLALVADQERMRWVFATHGIQVGDIIRTHSEIPRNPIRPKDGDSHPVGALPNGTKVHQIEITPGAGAKFCLAAGSVGEIFKRRLDSVMVKLPNGDQYKIEPSCMAVVGQMSNTGHDFVELWCPQRLRWLGKRPRSGQWRKKDGWCGRKNHPDKMMDVTFAAIQAKRDEEARAAYHDLTL